MATDSSPIFDHKNCCDCIRRQKEQIRSIYARLYDNLVDNTNSSIDSFNRVSTPIASYCDDCVNRLVSSMSAVYDKIAAKLTGSVAEVKGQLEPLCLCDVAGELKPSVKDAIQQYWDSLEPPFGEPAEVEKPYGKLIEEPLRQSENTSKPELSSEGKLPEPVPPFHAERIQQSKPLCPDIFGLTCCPLNILEFLTQKFEPYTEKIKEQSVAKLVPYAVPPADETPTLNYTPPEDEDNVE